MSGSLFCLYVVHVCKHIPEAKTTNVFRLFHQSTSGGNVPRKAALFQQSAGQDSKLADIDVNYMGFKFKKSALLILYEEENAFKFKHNFYLLTRKFLRVSLIQKSLLLQNCQDN